MAYTVGMIRKAILAEMKRREWTVYRLIKEASAKPDPVYKYLDGKREITTATLEPLLAALGLKLQKPADK